MTTRRRATLGTVLLVAMFVVGIMPVLGEGQAGTTLTADVDVVGYWTRTFHWTIEKAVTPDTWELFRGDSGTSRYTVTVTKDEGTDAAWAAGEICVTNGGEVATENLTIVAELKNGYGAPNDFLTSAPVDVSSNPILDPGETGCYDYEVVIPITGGAYPQPHAGGTYKVTANITITNHSGHLGIPFGPAPSATTVFPGSPTLINDTIHVDDTNGGSWTFSESGSQSYSKTFTCDADAGSHGNVATIRETGQPASASVLVHCYVLEVSKDAHTSFTRTYAWTIDKWADQSMLTLAIGEQFLVNYSVEVDATYTDSDWAVEGMIQVKNPAPVPATLNGVSDVVSPDIAASVDCGVSFPYVLGAGTTLQCIYNADLPDASGRTNQAVATLQNYDYLYDDSKTPSGTTSFSGSIPFDFSNASITYVDTCIDVSDSYAGSLGSVCASEAPKTMTYQRWIGPYAACGDYPVENTASFVTQDTHASGSDNWTVTVHVPCGGCTLTPGYWKTHSQRGPAPYDVNWKTLGPLEENTPFFLSGATYYQVLWTPPRGNVYYILSYQYIAAKLNILNGAASTPEVDAALSWAQSFFNTYTPSSKFSKTLKTQVTSYAELLDSYNNGYIGPGHCSE